MIVWLLELEVDGRIFRWGSQRVDTTDTDGTEITYRSGLPDLVLPDGATSVTVQIADPRVGWHRVGPRTQGSRAVLRRWVDDRPLDEAVVVLAGTVLAVLWDTDDEPAVLTISSLDGEAIRGQPLPDPLARVSRSTWPRTGATQGDEGIAYPIIFGYPGDEGEADPYPVVPVALAQWSATRSSTLAVVAEDPDLAITSVRLRNEATGAAGTEATQTVSRETDELGRALRCASFAASATGYPSTGSDRRSLYAGYSSTGGGGPRSAYDVIVYLLRRWGPDTVEWDRLGELQTALDPYRVDTWIDQPLPDPWTWLERVLLADLPVRVRVGARGRRLLVPRVIRPTAAQVVAELTSGRSVERVGAMTLDRPGPFNEYVAEFREDRRGGYRSRIIVWGGDDPLELGGPLPLTTAPGATSTQSIVAVRSGRCADSRAQYGRRRSPIVRTVDWTWDESTVLRLLEDQIELEAVPAIRASYTVRGTSRLTLREGDVLTITDEDRDLDARLAVVDEPPVVASSSTEITLRIPR